MRLLLDTHALLWWLADDAQLPVAARHGLTAAAEVYVSAASAWEIATKYRMGKLDVPLELVEGLDEAIAGEGFRTLPITTGHARRAGLLPGPHRDPFDRVLIAQSLSEGLRLVTNEELFELYGITRLWERP